MGSCCAQSFSICRIDTIINKPGNNVYAETLGAEQLDLFNDMPEFEGEKYVNYGIKRMKAYKCDLNIDDLNNLREQFWVTKISSNKKYRYIKQAILYDNNKCEEYLIKNGFNTVDGCINKCTDSSGYIYMIPNYCINDPYFEKELLEKNTTRETKKISIYLKHGDKEKEKVEVYDNFCGKKLKELFMAKAKIDNIKLENIRLFFGGLEIKNDDLLYQHEIKRHYTVQVLCNI